jgi:arginyl-tRNA synthetase
MVGRVTPADDRAMNDSDLFAAIRAQVVAALRGLLPELPAEAFARVLVEPPKDAAHGDMATNAAMVVAKLAKMPPPKLAAALCEKLRALPMVVEATPAGPGFVNLRLNEGYVRSVVPAVLAAGPSYGDGPAREGGPVNVEYVSANPTGPMHVGHCRGAVVGDALALLLRKAGYDVTREYYVNDAGAQVLALAYATYWRYLQALGTPMTEEDYAQSVPGGLQYKGEYLVPVGIALRQIFRESLAEPGGMPAPATLWLDTVRDFTVEAMMSAIREDLAALGVQHDVFISERAIVAEGWLEKAEATLSAKELIYTGVLEPPKGKTPDDWEPRPQTLFRASQFGDDVDRPLKKSDGSYTYFANDIAYHFDKFAAAFGDLIDVWGADHGGYVKRMQAAVTAISGGKGALDVKICQMVNLMDDGQPVRMSKRAGTFRHAARHCGRGGARRRPLHHADAQVMTRPGFRRGQGHRAVQGKPGLLCAVCPCTLPALGVLPPSELALIRRMAAWPRTVEAAAAAREPHRIAFFLQDLASDFHVLWNRGRDDATLRFIRAEEPEATRARLALVAATSVVLRSGLAVMGVEPVEEMR